MSRAFGFGERVRFLGWCGRPEELFAEADAAVFPFRWQEPFGLCGLEAAAHGVPVVAFDLGGVREWLIDGVTGIAVKPFDGKAMAAAVARLRDSAACDAKWGQTAAGWQPNVFRRSGFWPDSAVCAEVRHENSNFVHSVRSRQVGHFNLHPERGWRAGGAGT